MAVLAVDASTAPGVLEMEMPVRAWYQICRPVAVRMREYLWPYRHRRRSGRILHHCGR